MSEDKQVLILDSAQDELELDVEMELTIESSSDSPYCPTTMATASDQITCDKKFRNSGGGSNRHHPPSTSSTPAGAHPHQPSSSSSSSSVTKYSDRLRDKWTTSFSLLDGGGGRRGTRDCDNNGRRSHNPRFSQRISTISSNLLNYSGMSSSKQSGHRSSFSSSCGCPSCACGCCPVWLRRRMTRLSKFVAELWTFHWRMIVSSGLTVISSAGCLISFPIHLQGVTKDERSDGFSACFSIATILLLLFLLIALGVKLVYFGGRGGGSGRGRRSMTQGATIVGDDFFDDAAIFVFKPAISWKNILKIGFSVGLSVLSICSAWEDNKVLCNFQDPLLGLVIIFAIITHAVSKWRHVGFKRAFALLAVAAGVFVSVDYMLVDEHRCRGHYYAHPPKDMWTWKVHLVWTLAFIVAIWLWTVAMFCLESVIPYPPVRPRGEEMNAVKMTFLRLKPGEGGGGLTNSSNGDGSGNQSSVIETLTGGDQEPDLFTSTNKRRSPYDNPYSNISYMTVFNAVLWFHIATWTFILSLFWTEFIPGFGIGKGTSLSSFGSVVLTSFEKCFHDACSWCLIISLFVYSQSFTYLILLLRSSVIAICVSCLGFPIVGLWWSVFQMNHNFFVWMPAINGEFVCSFVGLPLIFFGTVYMFKLDILEPRRMVVTL